MQEWLEQLSILGCRLVDAAASGKSKQLIQDTKDLAWKGIETATDPATTLGLAEFTAHMCHALEEAQNSLNPTPRAQRNAQNQTTYIKPLQMSDYPRNVSMEEIILSCLGRGGEERDDDEDATSIPSKVIWDEEQPTAGYNDQEWKERGERVDTELLKDRILRNQRPQSRRHPPPSAISSAKSSIASVGPTLESLPMIPSQDYEESVDPNHQISQEKSKGECDENIIVDQNVETIERGADIEDIAWDKLQPEIKRATRVGEDTRPSSRQKQGDDIPATLQFYRILDDMLKQKRSERLDRQVGEDATINNPSQRIPRNSSQDPFKLLKAKVRKLKKDNTQRISKATPPQGRKTFRQLSKQRQACVLFFAVVMAWVVFIWIGFAFYGMYMFINVEPTATPTNIQTESRNIPSSTNSEVVIRIVREVVHVREDGSIIETSSSDSIASEEDIEKVTECVASAFQIN